MNCTTKGCNKQMEPYLDKKSNKVYCSLCDNEMLNVSPFTITQLKTLKQFKVKVQEPFSVKCLNCEDSRQPKIENNKYYCKSCKKELINLTEAFKMMLKTVSKNSDI